MNLPLVSVIVPTHNRLPLLREAIGSVLAQDYPNLELIVVDDGSTDGTPTALHTFSHPKLRYHFIRNRGAAGARNVGIGLARGALVALLDSDDLWRHDKLSLQVRHLAAHPEVGMLASNFRYVDAAGHPVSDPAKPFGYRLHPRFVPDILDSTFPMCTSVMLIRREVFERCGVFNEQLRIAEDLDLWLRIGLDYKVAYLDEVLASVRLHPQHLMRSTPRHEVWLQSARVVEAHRARVAACCPELEQQLAQFYARAGNLALLEGRRGAALGAFAQALRRAPLQPRRYKDIVRCALPLAYLRQRYARHLRPSAHPLMQLYR